MPPRRELCRTIPGFYSPSTFLRSTLVLAPFVLCTLTITSMTATTAQSDTDASPYSCNEYGDPRTSTVSANNARALDAVSILVLRYASPLVRRAAVVRGGDNHGSRLSGQALTAIILSAAIVFCVLVGCLLQLPAALISLRNRYFRSERTPTPTPSSSNSMPGLFDVELGDQLPESLACDAPSPPPPYSRAPSYESSRDDTGTGGRDERTS